MSVDALDVATQVPGAVRAVVLLEEDGGVPQDSGERTVWTLAAAVRWFEENGVPFGQAPGTGKMRDVAFIKGPDGYWIEIIQPDLLARLGA